MSCENRTTTETKKSFKKLQQVWLKEEWRSGCYSLRSFCETSVDQYSVETNIELKSPSEKWGKGSDPEMIKKKKKAEMWPRFLCEEQQTEAITGVSGMWRSEIWVLLGPAL